jgi:hypothetical protein
MASVPPYSGRYKRLVDGQIVELDPNEVLALGPAATEADIDDLARRKAEAFREPAFGEVRAPEISFEAERPQISVDPRGRSAELPQISQAGPETFKYDPEMGPKTLEDVQREELARKAQAAIDAENFWKNEVPEKGILAAHIPGANPEVPTLLDAFAGLIMPLERGSASKTMAENVRKDFVSELQKRITSQDPRQDPRSLPDMPVYGPFNIDPVKDIEPVKDIQAETEAMARATSGQATDAELAALRSESFGPFNVPADTSGPVGVSLKSGYTPTPTSNVLDSLKKVHGSVAKRIQELTGRTEPGELDLIYNPKRPLGEYRGLRTLGIGRKRGSDTAAINIEANASITKDPETFARIVFRNFLEEITHGTGLHELPKEGNTIPANRNLSGVDIELPPEANIHNAAGDTLRMNLPTQEGRLYNDLYMYMHDPVILAAQDKFINDIKKSGVFESLKSIIEDSTLPPEAIDDYIRFHIGEATPGLDPKLVKKAAREADIDIDLTPLKQPLQLNSLDDSIKGTAPSAPTEAPPPDATVTFRDFAEARKLVDPKISGKDLLKQWKEFRDKQEKSTEATKVKTKPPQLGSLSWFDRVARPVVHNWGKVKPELGQTARAFIDRKERLTGDLISEYDKIVTGLNSEQKNQIRQWLENQYQGPLTKELEGPANRIKLLNKVAFDLAEGADVLKKERTYYFPHRFAVGKGPKPEIVIRSTSKGIAITESSFEKKRRSNRKDYIKDLDVLKEYYYDVAKRVAIAEAFGVRGQKIAAALKGAKTNKETFNYLAESFKALTEHSSRRSPYAIRQAMKVISWLQLPFAAPLQAGQITNTAAYGGVGRSAEALWQLAKKANRQEKLKEALASGALNPDILMEISGRSGDGQPILGRLPPAIRNSLWGIPTADRAMRVHAYTVGTFLARDARAGEAEAVKMIQSLGLDPSKASPAEVGRVLSDKTQFRTGPGEIPLWASSPYGRMIFQYKNFLYRYTIFAGGMLRDAKQGNAKPLATFMAAAPVVGELVNDLRALLKGDSLSDEEKRKNWTDEEWLKAFTSRRVPWDKPAARLFQNWLTTGGLGILQPYVEQTFLRDSPATLGELAGPVPSVAEKGLRAVGTSVHKGDVTPLAKFGISEGVPGYGKKLSRELFSEDEGRKSSSRGRRRRSKRR